MLNFRYRNQTSAWPGFVDLFSNLVIILIFLLIMFVFLWTTTSVFNKSTGARTVAELKQINAEQAATIQEMESYKQEANRLLLLARDELLSLEQDNTELATELNDIDVSIEDLISAYENKIGQLQDLVSQNNAELTNNALLAAEMQKQLAQLNAALSAAEEKSRAQEVE